MLSENNLFHNKTDFQKHFCFCCCLSVWFLMRKSRFCVNYDASLSDFSSLTSGSAHVTPRVSHSVNSVVIPPSASMSPNWNNPCRRAQTHRPGQLSWWVQFNPPCDSDLSSPLAGTIWTRPSRDICCDVGEELWSAPLLPEASDRRSGFAVHVPLQPERQLIFRQKHVKAGNCKFETKCGPICPKTTITD